MPLRSLLTKQFLLRLFLLLILSFTVVAFFWGTSDSNANLKKSSISYGNRRKLSSFRSYYTLDDDNLHFGVVIDCGSSGSRLFVFAWPTHSGSNHQLLDIRPLAAANGKHIVKKVSPGISSFASTPSKAFEYLSPLLDFASSALPKDMLQETPLYILCTAGMRLITTQEQEAILDVVRKGIKKNYQFAFTDSHAEVITGKREGVYAWIATNYLLGRFDHKQHDGVALVEHENGHARKQTMGVIDMGGGSFQIAFEVTRSQAASLAASKDLIAEFNLGCVQSDDAHSYSLYVTTFLGLGANSARDTYETNLVTDFLAHMNRTNDSVTRSVTDPCLTPGLAVKSSQGVTLVGAGNYSECLRRVFPLLGRDVPCQFEHCSLHGQHQPPIDFIHSEFMGFSEYWYTMNDVLGIGGEYSYLLFHSAARKYCHTDWSVLSDLYKHRKFPKADDHRMSRREDIALQTMLKHKRFQCFKSAWIIAVLHYGLKFPRIYKKFKTVSEIGGTEVQWTLGAIVHKTRYFPLREIQQRLLEVKKLKNRRSSHLSYFYQYLLLLLGVFIVAFAIFRLHRHVPGLGRISSSYLLT